MTLCLSVEKWQKLGKFLNEKMSKSLLVILDWRYCSKKKPVFRIHRIHMFLGLPDPDSLVRGKDPDPGPDPSVIKQKS
jgi:hypothetical protein